MDFRLARRSAIPLVDDVVQRSCRGGWDDSGWLWSVSLPANQIIVLRTHRRRQLAAASHRSRSNRANVFRFRLSGLAILTDIVAYLRAISQRSARQHRRDMDKHILPAIVGRDEAKALVLTVPVAMMILVN